MDTLLQFENMLLEKEGRRAWLTLTRESHLNAVNNDGTRQIIRLAMALREDPHIRIVVIRGRGRAFCTGIDLKELSSGKINMRYHERWEKALRIFETMEKIVIVGMHGYCLGGGLQLALAGDIRVSTRGCQIGLPAIRESLIPGLATWRLPRYVGWGRAKKMIIGGENIDGKEAEAAGLVDHLVPEKGFFDHLDQVASGYLKSCSTGSRLSKLMINQSYDSGYEEIAAMYFKLQERTQFSLDAEESQRAYRENREPVWQ